MNRINEKLHNSYDKILKIQSEINRLKSKELELYDKLDGGLTKKIKKKMSQEDKNAKISNPAEKES